MLTRLIIPIKNNITNISAKSHPKHYLMHKYWGRKAHNVISDYIKYFSKNDDIVLDPFMGSGTTARACVNLERKYIGFEIDQRQVDFANNELKNMSRQLSLF